MSPYDLSPGGANPLRNILAETVDFDRLAQASIKLFVTATNVRTGRGRVFRNSEIKPDVLLASACLPTLFRSHSPPSRRLRTLAGTPITLRQGATVIEDSRRLRCDRAGHRPL
jgi:hypothetical protein